MAVNENANGAQHGRRLALGCFCCDLSARRRQFHDRRGGDPQRSTNVDSVKEAALDQVVDLVFAATQGLLGAAFSLEWEGSVELPIS